MSTSRRGFLKALGTGAAVLLFPMLPFRKKKLVRFPVIYSSVHGPMAYVWMDEEKAKRLLEAKI